MGLSITQKILEQHRVGGELTPGAELSIRIDQALTQDATGTMAYLQFETMGIERVRCETAVSYVDHNTVQVGHENADDHAYLRTAAARYGAMFSPPGNGICHQVHLERFGAPGKTLLGSDSHTPTGGGIGMIAIGAGGIDVAVAMGGGPFYLAAPRVIRVNLEGALPAWVSAKDVILKVLEILSTKGNVGCVLEYGGSGVAGLDVPARATITNMGAECGVTTSVFPSDDVTRRFLAAQGREDAWCELSADADAVYEREITIDLSGLEPLAAAPHSPGNVVSVASLAGTPVQQVVIGSCTNSSYRDLSVVAHILSGRRAHAGTELGIAPGSRQVLTTMAAEGKLSGMIDAGARVLESACGFCIGNSMAPATGAVSLRTSNRNFEGRSGTASAQVYLVSPETAAASALAGTITDPRAAELGSCPDIALPDRFRVDDAQFVYPPADGSRLEVVRGPNIGEVPAGEPLLAELDGVVTIKVGDKITTDHIMPAGARLKLRSNVPAYAQYVFEHTDPGFAARAAAYRDAGRHNVIVAGESYGQGSSREHAALCPMYLGVRAVIARSIERIHCANLINFGIVPFLFEDAAGLDGLEAGDALRIAGLRECVAGDGRAELQNVTRGTALALRVELTERQKQIILAGGLLRFVAQSRG